MFVQNEFEDVIVRFIAMLEDWKFTITLAAKAFGVEEEAEEVIRKIERMQEEAVGFWSQIVREVAEVA